MATKSEQSVIDLLHGRPSTDGYRDELARPELRNSPSGNYGLTSELALDLEAEAEHDLAALAESAPRWERHLEPGRPGNAMGIEPDSAVYVAWIVLPVDGAFHVFTRHDFGRLVAERAHWWLRAWLTMAAIGMAPRVGKLISDRDDPPGDAVPGPVRATSSADDTPWTGAPGPRRNRGVLPSVLCGERAWQRSYPPKYPADDYRLCRGYLDQPGHSAIAQLSLDIDAGAVARDAGDWAVQFLGGVRARFGAARLLGCLTDEERANIRRAWQSKSVEDAGRVLPYLDGYLYRQTMVLACLEDGSLWRYTDDGGNTSTASTYAATWDARTGESAWLACDSGIRKSKDALDAVVKGRGWEDGDDLCCERSDGRFGVRRLRKPAGVERWRLTSSPSGHVFSVGGQPVAVPTAPSGPAPGPTPGAGAPASGPPAEYHELCGRLPGMVAACVGKLSPDEVAYLGSVLRAQADLIDPRAPVRADPERRRKGGLGGLFS